MDIIEDLKPHLEDALQREELDNDDWAKLKGEIEFFYAGWHQVKSSLDQHKEFQPENRRKLILNSISAVATAIIEVEKLNDLEKIPLLQSGSLSPFLRNAETLIRGLEVSEKRLTKGYVKPMGRLNIDGPVTGLLSIYNRWHNYSDNDEATVNAAREGFFEFAEAIFQAPFFNDKLRIDGRLDVDKTKESRPQFTYVTPGTSIPYNTRNIQYIKRLIGIPPTKSN